MLLISTPVAFADNHKLPLEAMREFNEVYHLIRSQYVSEVDATNLMRDAIRGLVNGLDEHSAYLSPEDLERFNSSIEGNYGGVGLYIDIGQGAIRVVAPIDNSPADDAGVLAGDFIVKIDEAKTKKMTIEQASTLMRGIAGTDVTLSVLRAKTKDQIEELEFVLERAVIDAPSVRSALTNENFGYVRISQFLRRDKTTRELAKHIDELYATNNNSLDGLILDLRSNPGGDLDASICVASIFLQRNTIIVTDRGRNYDNEHLSNLSNCPSPSHTDLTREINLVVLVNGGSASASEIVAGALQDNQRAKIIGTTSYGKASVQRILDLRSTGGKSALKLTSAHYYTPAGTNIHKIGISPDIEYVPPEDVEQKLDDPRIPLALGEKEDRPFLPKDDPIFDLAIKELSAMKLDTKITALQLKN